MADLLTARVLAEALGALSWIQGYTDADFNGEQLKTKIINTGDDWMDIEVFAGRHHSESVGRFHLKLEVTPHG